MVQLASTGRPQKTTVRYVRPASVARVALAFSLSLSAIFLLGLVALYLLGLASGALENFEAFIANLGFPEFEVRLVGVILVSGILAGVTSVAFTVTVTFCAVLYNILAELLGGVEIDSRQP